MPKRTKRKVEWPNMKTAGGVLEGAKNLLAGAPSMVFGNATPPKEKDDHEASSDV